MHDHVVPARGAPALHRLVDRPTRVEPNVTERIVSVGAVADRVSSYVSMLAPARGAIQAVSTGTLECEGDDAADEA